MSQSTIDYELAIRALAALCNARALIQEQLGTTNETRDQVIEEMKTALNVKVITRRTK